MAKGLMLDVYRRAAGGADCTNGGITAHAPYLVVTGVIRPGGPGWVRGQQTAEPLPADCQAFSPRPDAPEVTLVIRRSGHITWIHLEPAEGRAEGSVGLMAGGNYAGSSDSRWAGLTSGIDLVSVHDRNETPEQYADLSR